MFQQSLYLTVNLTPFLTSLYLQYLGGGGKGIGEHEQAQEEQEKQENQNTQEHEKHEKKEYEYEE